MGVGSGGCGVGVGVKTMMLGVAVAVGSGVGNGRGVSVGCGNTGVGEGGCGMSVAVIVGGGVGVNFTSIAGRSVTVGGVVGTRVDVSVGAGTAAGCTAVSRLAKKKAAPTNAITTPNTANAATHFEIFVFAVDGCCVINLPIGVQIKRRHIHFFPWIANHIKNRQREIKRGAAPHFCFEPHLTTVGFDDVFYN